MISPCQICHSRKAKVFVLVQQDNNRQKAHVCMTCFDHLKNTQSGEDLNGSTYPELTVTEVSQAEFNEAQTTPVT